MKGLLLGVMGVAGAAAAGWAVLVKVQGDSEIAVEPEALTNVTFDGRAVRGEVTLVNRGKVGGVVHKVDSRLTAGWPGRVLVTRQGSRPPHRGWWQSNCLPPGESCVAEVDIELDGTGGGDLSVELDVHEIGRRLVAHRIVRLAVNVPAATPAP
ncbi:MAG: hypothetical protein ACRD12_00820 [Acidimicrobiales bacterium]